MKHNGLKSLFISKRKRETGITWQHSIFTRITVTFAIIVLPLYGLGIFFYQEAMKSVRTEITSSMVSQVDFYMKSLEVEATRIQNQLFDMISDTYLNRLAAIPDAMDGIGRTQAFWNLQNRMEAIRISSRYISSFTAYVPAIDRVVTDRHVDVLDHDRFVELTEMYREYALIHNEGDVPVILVESSYLDSQTREPQFILAVELDQSAFQHALSQFDKYPGSGTFLIDTTSRRNLASLNIDAKTEDQILARMHGETSGYGYLEKTQTEVAGLYVYSRSPSLGMDLVFYVPEAVVFAAVERYRVWFFIFSLVALIVIVIYSFSMNRLINRPLMRMIDAFRQVEKGDLQVAIEHPNDDEFRFLYRRFNTMVHNLDGLIEQVYTMKILNQRAELKQLQSQINPHFLYNSFFILQRRIKGGDYENAERFSSQLGHYFRFITRNADEEVPLHLEIEHARTYAEIQRIRFVSRIQVLFEPLPDRWHQIMVPRLILQPIIENAFEHGLDDKASDGLLHITFLEYLDKLLISVDDNGDQLNDTELERLQIALTHWDSTVESTATINIHRRLILSYGPDCGVTVGRSRLGGLHVTICLKSREGVLDVPAADC